MTYTKDIKPLFMAKCAPCHTTDGLGAHNIGTTYADVNKPVQSLDAPAGCFKDGFDKTMPKTMGECAWPRSWRAGCRWRWAVRHAPARRCVTLAQQDSVAAWVAAGMPE